MNFENFEDINSTIEVELGKTTLSLFDILNLKKGSIVDLNKPAGENAEIFLNKRIFARGEIIVYEKNLGVRISEIPELNNIIRYLKEEKEIFN